MRLKAAAREEGCDFLTWNDIQACVDQVNFTVQEEHEREIHSFLPSRLNDWRLSPALPLAS